MDRDTVTLAIIAFILLTATLIAVSLVVPRLFRRRGSFVTATAGGGSGANRVALFGTPTPGAPRTFVAAGDPRLGREPHAVPDELTGLLTPAGWGRVISEEDARVRRYRRAATVVMIEVDGLDRLVERLGPAAADKLIPAVSATVRRLAREADHVARLGEGRFGALLPETDEIQAIHYVERVRRTCDLWLESGAVSLRLAIGWASADGDDNLHEAARTATERMFAEVHRHARTSSDLAPMPNGPDDEGTRSN